MKPPAKAPDNDERRAALKRWMAARDLTIYEVAKGAKIPASTLYTYMRGTTGSLNGATQEAIAAAFASTVAEMFGTPKRQRWLPVTGAVSHIGEAVAHPTPKRVACPEWLAGSEGLEVYQMDHHTAAGPFGLGHWLLVFRSSPSPTKPAALAGAVALADLDDARRIVCRLVMHRGKLQAIGMGGETIKGAKVVRAIPLIGMAAPPRES